MDALGRCRESAGFLVAHPCKEPASQKCKKCAKPICAAHARDGLCIECYRVSFKADSSDPYLLGAFYYRDFQTVSQYDSYSRKDREAFEGKPEEDEWESAWETDYDGS